jgi:ATP-dependent RNA helicase DeaD
LLRVIERATRQPVSPLALPTIQAVNDVRIARFKVQITETLDAGGLEVFQSLIEEYEREQNVPALEIAAALAKIARGEVPLLLDKNQREPQAEQLRSDDRATSGARFEHGERHERAERGDRAERPLRPHKERIHRAPDPGMQTFRIEVGHVHGVKPGNIVGAIANEAGIDSKHIGRIEIYDDYSTLDLPGSLPDALLKQLQKVWVAGQQLRISRDGEAPMTTDAPANKKAPAADKPGGGSTAGPAEKASREAGGIEAAERPAVPKKGRSSKGEVGMEAYRIEIGHAHGVKPANIVGAIANEAGLEAKYIGRIDIFDHHSVLDLPEGMPKEIFEQLKTVTVAGHPLRISHAGAPLGNAAGGDGKKPAFSTPKKGGDRRVHEKSLRDKTSSKGSAPSSKPKPKPHRKGAKSP